MIGDISLILAVLMVVSSFIYEVVIFKNADWKKIKDQNKEVEFLIWGGWKKACIEVFVYEESRRVVLAVRFFTLAFFASFLATFVANQLFLLLTTEVAWLSSA